MESDKENVPITAADSAPPFQATPPSHSQATSDQGSLTRTDTTTEPDVAHLTINKPITFTTSTPENRLDVGITDEQLQSLVDMLVAVIGSRRPSAAMIASLVYKCMKLTKKFRGLTALQEVSVIKAAVTICLRKCDFQLTQDELEMLDDVVDVLAPSIINLVTEVRRSRWWKKLSCIKK